MDTTAFCGNLQWLLHHYAGKAPGKRNKHENLTFAWEQDHTPTIIGNWDQVQEGEFPIVFGGGCFRPAGFWGYGEL